MRKRMRIYTTQRLSVRWLAAASSAIVAVAVILILINVGKTEEAHASTTESLDAGSFIINMGITPQTNSNALKPYGMVYDLIENHGIPVKWVINDSKGKDGIDFTYNGVDYKGGPFIIPVEFITPDIAAVIATWTAQGVQGVYTNAEISVPVYTTVTSYPNVMLDTLSGLDSIVAKYYSTAGIPAAAYERGSPGGLTTCHDLWTNPHGDPTWATHGNLYNFVTVQKSFIWAECHSVSMMEACVNPGNTSQKLNFLSTQGLQCYQSSGSKCPGISESHSKSASSPYTYNHHADPVMQFMGNMHDACTDGSEQWFIPATAGEWRTNVKRGVSTATGASPKEGTVLVYGPGFGDPSNGYVMYEGGHDLLTSGSSATNRIAAVRAYHNYVLLAGKMKQFDATFDMASSIPPGGTANAIITPVAGTPPFTYEWTANAGSFNSTYYHAVLYTAPNYENDTTVVIKATVRDACGRQNIFYRYLSLSSGALPVELNSFSGMRNNDDVILKWSTASEKNNDFFTVERSTDGETYKPVIKVLGKGNTHSGHSYSVTDKSVPAGIIYYRLRQTDIDGSTAIYKTISVKDGKTGKGSISSIGPNPFNDHFVISIESEESQEVTASLYTQNGQLVDRQNFTLSEGVNAITFYSKAVDTGIYILKVTGRDAELGSRKLSKI